MSARRRCRVTSADIPGLLRTLSKANVALSDIETDGRLTVSYTVPALSAGLVRKTCKKRGEQVRFSRYGGFAFALWDLRKRPVFLLTVFLLLGLTWLLPSRVLFVEVEGNSRVESRAILEQASQCGIGFWASRWEVRSEKTKNALLEALPELQWAGVNTRGCVAVISVRERDVPDSEAAETGIGSIVAARDGVIVSCTVTRGSGLCVPGQAVRAGQALISGYTDCGRTITAVRAQGEVMAETRRNLTACTPSETLRRTDCQTETVRYSLLIGKKRINFFQGSGISDGSCVKMKQVSILTLPGGFRLPAALIRETVAVSGFSTGTLDEATARARLAGYAAGYLRRQMIAGQILSCAEFLDASDGLYRLTGEYACTEMIGRFQTEQIGEYHGKTD